MNHKEYVELFECNIEKIKTHLGWAADKRVTIMLAGRYSAEGKEFSSQSFSEVIEAIKQQTKWYHSLRVNVSLQHSIAMMLDGKGEPNSLVNELLENEEILKSSKFTTTQFSYIAALFLSKDEQKKLIAENAQKLYKAIRKHHPFLTSNEDVPYAVLLSSEEDDAELRAETMNRYYKELRKSDFSIGNDLQWLSQILTFHGANYIENLVPYVVEIRKQLGEEGIKIKPTHYPVLGFLAVVGIKTQQIKEIGDLYKDLSQLKQLRWYKDVILSIAVQKVLIDLVTMNESLEMSVITSLEMLIQAEQAMIMTATIVAIVASSTGTSTD